MKKRVIRKKVDPREPKLVLVAGKKGVGKTYKTLELCQKYMRPDKALGKTGRKVLIFDVNNEFGDVKTDHSPDFKEVKTIKQSEIAQFGKWGGVDIRRVTPYKDSGGKMSLKDMAETLKYILDNYFNGMLIIEDITKYISDSLPADIIGAICTQRHLSVDVIIHVQTVGKLFHPQLWGNANEIRLHKAEGSVVRHAHKNAGDIQHLLIMENLIMVKIKQGNPRFHCYLDKDAGKIIGQFSRKDFAEAIMVYLGNNQKEVKKLAAKEDLMTGKKLYGSRGDAVNGMIRDMVEEYYGNP